MAIRKIPQRRCVGCGQSKDKRELLRVVRSADGDISNDITGKKRGRGAYICKDLNCLEMAIKKKKLERSFCIKIEPELYQTIKDVICDK